MTEDRRKTANFGQIASLRRYTLDDGVRVTDCDNGKLRFLLNESRALDIMQVYWRGENISFVSKNGFASREQAFAKRFEGGMLYTCGLDSIGVRDGFPQHGSLHGTPARLTRAECTAEGITVVAELPCTSLFGQNLLLTRTVHAAICSDRVSVTDTLQNRGFRPARYCLLYHVNFGYPFLDEGGMLVAERATAAGLTPWAEQNVADWRKITAPQDDTQETCYYLENVNGAIQYVSPDGRRARLTYTDTTLPQFVVWKSMLSGDYALGLEPATTRFDEAFAYAELAAGASETFGIELQLEGAR